MDHLERELRESMGRLEPPAGFAGRIIARAEAPARRAALWRQWQWAAACLILCLAIGWPVHHQWRERQEGQAAKEKLLRAIELTANRLQTVRQKVQEFHR